MNEVMKNKVILLLATLLFAATGLRASDVTLSLPTFTGNPDGLIRVPVEISSAAGLASIRVQVNFDPALLVLERAEPGMVGKEFDFSYAVDSGAVTLMLVRSTDLPFAGGSIAELVFRANSGSTTDHFSDLTVALFELGDTTGVVDQTAKVSIETKNGEVLISNSATLDNRPNGMPDAWEEKHGINPLTSLPTTDSDGDGLSDIMEFAFSGNPRKADARERKPIADTAVIENKHYLVLDFRKPVDIGSLVYEIQESDDLIKWTTRPLSECLAATPNPRGDGTEDVTVKASEPIRTNSDQYLRVRVRW